MWRAICARVVDVVDLHLDAGHAVAGVVEGLRLVEVGVDELRVVLIEAGVEHRDHAELLGDRRADRAARVGEADGRRRDLHAVAELDVEVLRQRRADDDAGQLLDRCRVLAGIGIDFFREHVVVGQLARVAALGLDVADRRAADRGRLVASSGITRIGCAWRRLRAVGRGTRVGRDRSAFGCRQRLLDRATQRYVARIGRLADARAGRSLRLARAPAEFVERRAAAALRRFGAWQPQAQQRLLNRCGRQRRRDRVVADARRRA